MTSMFSFICGSYIENYVCIYKAGRKLSREKKGLSGKREGEKVRMGRAQRGRDMLNYKTCQQESYKIKRRDFSLVRSPCSFLTEG